MNATLAYPAAGSTQGFRLERQILLTLGCTLLLVACTPITPKRRSQEPAASPATVERVSDYDIRHSRGGAEAYGLSPRERLLCEKKAAAGDIVAAKTLLEYYEMVVVDQKQYQHWLNVVERLQRAQVHRSKQSSR